MSGYVRISVHGVGTMEGGGDVLTSDRPHEAPMRIRSWTARIDRALAPRRPIRPRWRPVYDPEATTMGPWVAMTAVVSPVIAIAPPDPYRDCRDGDPNTLGAHDPLTCTVCNRDREE